MKISKDRETEGLNILAKGHADSDASNSFVQAEFREICDTIRLGKQSSKQGRTDTHWSCAIL
ncbi:hypothetical protein AC578_9806 [Pseudocercospora eumusae]|uniref:Uncharacterized protein n=1 Tax=Pseudocercospora eumusae TaxID=321146 RepID=A0A139H9M8_9PEZI|nr:hypothetical protein AC578_9806 [Pseudocercospora eumusae]